MAENDQLANYLRAVGGLGGRRQSLQSRLAEQMMAGLQNQTPIYSTGAAVARAGEGLLAGLMAKSANDAETKREDELYQRGIDRQDEQRLRDNQETQDFQERFFPAARPAPETSVPAPINMPTTSTNDTFLNALERYESNGSSAPNPRSTAAGNFQFIDDTWRAFARANPDSFSGMDDAAILAARSDPQLGRQAAQWYAGENSRYLADQNLPNGYAEQALAHGFGPGGAAAILRAAPDALVVNAVPNGDRVLAANPNLRDVTVQDYLARNNARYGAAFTNPSGSQPSDVQNLLAGFRAASSAAPAGPPQALADGTAAPVAALTAAPAGAPAGAPFSSQANPNLMKAYIAAASSANPQIRAMAPGILAQVNRQDILAARVDPTVETDGAQGPGIYTRDANGKLTFIGPRLPPREGAETFTGAPQIVMQDGQQVLVQMGSQGTVRRIEGFTPRNEGPYQGNSIEAQDSNVLLRGNPASAEYAAAFARQGATRYNVDGSTVTPNMSPYRPPTYNPNLPASPAASSIAPPVAGATPPEAAAPPPNFAASVTTDATKPTADQLKVSTYAARMATANDIIGRVGYASTGVADRILDRIPGVGNFVTSSEFQLAKQAQADFINAVLRRESGAVISDSEFANAAKQYFPQPGDKPDVLEQKRQNRATTLLGFEREAGPAAQPRTVPARSDNIITFDRNGNRISK